MPLRLGWTKLWTHINAAVVGVEGIPAEVELAPEEQLVGPVVPERVFRSFKDLVLESLFERVHHGLGHQADDDARELVHLQRGLLHRVAEDQTRDPQLRDVIFDNVVVVLGEVLEVDDGRAGVGPHQLQRESGGP